MTTELLTAAEAASHLRIRPSTLRLWARRGLVPTVRLSRKIIRFNIEDVIEAVKHRKAVTR